MKVERTKEELLEELSTQLKFLEDDCSRYDEGNVEYAKRIALQVRILLYDPVGSNSRSMSLLKQLERAFQIQRQPFYTLSVVETANLYNVETTHFVRSSLVRYYFEHGEQANTFLDPFPVLRQDLGKRIRRVTVDFDSWWDKTIIFAVDPENLLTRKKVILWLANTDGGAHVDFKIDETLAAIKRKEVETFKLQLTMENKEKFYTGIVDKVLYATVRTIAEEVLITLQNEIMRKCAKKLE